MIPSSCWVFLYLIRVDCIVQSLAIVKVERSFWPFFGVNCPCGSGLKIFRPKNGAKILKLLWWDRVLCTVLKCFCCSQSAHVRSCYVRIWSIFSHFFLQRFFPPRVFALSDWNFPTLCCPIVPKTFPLCMGCDGASFETFWHDFWRSGVVGGTRSQNCANVPWKSLNWSNSGLSPPKVFGFSRTKKFVDPTRAHGSESVEKNAIACSVPKKLQNFRVFRGKCPFIHCYVELHPNLLGSPWSCLFYPSPIPRDIH